MMIHNATSHKRKEQDLNGQVRLFWALLRQVTGANVHLLSTLW